MMLSPCGVDCTQCSSYRDTCAGCREIKGKVYWAGYVGAEVCPMYGCCINEKKMNHCGECAELPCRLYFDTRDPSVSEEEHEAGIRLRADTLKKVRESREE